MAQYEYKPLQPGNKEIRLIKLLPASTCTNIEIEIFHMERSSNPTYEALSYVWGCSDRTDIVFVRNQHSLSRGRIEAMKPLKSIQRNQSESISTLPITHNLSVALRHLNPSIEPRVLWIDAICINQDDSRERSTEVIEMGSIYSNAVQVLVWLGPSSGNSVIAMETLAKIGHDISYLPVNYTVSTRKGSWVAQLEEDTEALRSNAYRWVAIGDLLRRQWFSRLWVFQEIGLATKATVLAGEFGLNWNIFVTALNWVWKMLDRLNKAAETLAIEDFSSNNISGFLRVAGRQRGHFWPLETFLEITKQLSCSDPRDRLYAIHSLLEPTDRNRIIPNYSKDIEVEEVFKNVMLAWINDAGRADLLLRCLLHDSPPALKLPSWVPDLSFQNLPPRLSPYFKAAGKSKAVATYEETYNSLGVSGRKVATITKVFPSAIKRTQIDTEIFEICRTWEPPNSRSASYVGGGSIFDAFLETLLCGDINDTMLRVTGDYVTMEECERVFEGPGIDGRDESDRLKARVAGQLRAMLSGRTFLNSAEGFIGVCPDSAKCQDLVVVVLGCSSPLVFRPMHERGNHYRVVGECYVPGFTFAEAFLGPFPQGWSKRFLSRGGCKFCGVRIWKHCNTARS